MRGERSGRVRGPVAIGDETADVPDFFRIWVGHLGREQAWVNRAATNSHRYEPGVPGSVTVGTVMSAGQRR